MGRYRRIHHSTVQQLGYRRRLQNMRTSTAHRRTGTADRNGRRCRGREGKQGYWCGAVYVCCESGHPVLLEVIARIVQKAGGLSRRVEEHTIEEIDVIVETGPVTLTTVVQEWIKKRYDASFNWRREFRSIDRIESPTLIRDILVLPPIAMDACTLNDVDLPTEEKLKMYVRHSTQSSWQGYFKNKVDLKGLC